MRERGCGKQGGVARCLPSRERQEIQPMSVKEVEMVIAQLSPKELAELMAWLETYHAQVWDEEIAQDLEAGRLDPLLAEVDKEYEAGLGQPL